MPGWRDFMARRINGEEEGVPWHLEDKLLCQDFCRDEDIPTARTLFACDQPQHIPYADLPDEFVVKPTLDWSRKGVMLLRRDGQEYWDSLRRKHYDTAGITRVLGAALKRRAAEGNRIVVEELIHDVKSDAYSIPRDFKAYCFNGHVAIVQEIDRNTRPISTSWYDGEFVPIGRDSIVTNPEYVSPRVASAPEDARSLVELASRVSRLLATPFVRVDMYLTRSGPVVGELTFTPGGLYYGRYYKMSSQLDSKLGVLWERAAVELGKGE